VLAGVSPEEPGIRPSSMGNMDYSRFQIYDFGRLWVVFVGDWNLRFGRFDLAKQPVLARVQRAWTRTSLQLRTAAQCSSPARLLQSVRDDTTEREIELAG
jgi:hypothetical protein